MKITITAAAVIIFTFYPLSVGLAYSLNEADGWVSKQAKIRASKVSFPPGSPYTSALIKAIERWNENPSKFRFKLVADDDGKFAFLNGKNEVYFTTDPGELGGRPAVCWWTWGVLAALPPKTVMWEADIAIDAVRAGTDVKDPSKNGPLWTPYEFKHEYDAYMDPMKIAIANRRMPIIPVMMHELGHAMGLGHDNKTYNLMGGSYGFIHANGASKNIPTLRSYSGADANAGAVAIYGLGKTAHDLSVTHWKYSGISKDEDGDDSEYSLHENTKIYDASGNELPWEQIKGVNHWKAKTEQTLQTEFTYENNGTGKFTAWVGFYLSKNDVITTADTRFADAKITLDRGEVKTIKHNVKLPSSDAVKGKRWLGVIVDYFDATKEVTEVNNATHSWWPLQIEQGGELEGWKPF